MFPGNRSRRRGDAGGIKIGRESNKAKKVDVSLEEEIDSNQAKFVALDIAYRKKIASRLFAAERLDAAKVGE